MPKELKKISDSISEVKQELIRVGYCKGRVDLINEGWKRLLVFAEMQKEEFFTEQLASAFIEDFDYQCKNVKKLSLLYQRTIRHSITMLSDYQLHNCIYRRCRKRNVIFPAKYNDAMENFIIYSIKRNHKKSTIRRSRAMVSCFIEYLLNNGVSDCFNIEPYNISNYFAFLLGFSSKTMASYSWVIRTFLKSLYFGSFHEKDLSEFVPTLHLPSPITIPKIWSKEDISSLLNSVDRGTPIGKRDYCILLLLAQLGLRDSDIQNLKLEDIVWHTNEVNFVQTKTLQRICLPLSKELGWAIIDYLKNGRPKTDSQNIIVRHTMPYDNILDCYNIVKKYLAFTQIKVEKGTPHGPHSLRHTLASRLLANDVPVAVISSMLGHINANSVNTYLHIDIENLRKCALSINEVKAHE